MQLLARAQQTGQRQRRDFPHKTALALVREYATSSRDDLQARTLTRRPQATPDGGERGLSPQRSRAKSWPQPS